MEIRGSFDETWSAATAGLLFNRAVIPALLFAHSILCVCELFVGETFLLPPSLLSTTMFIAQYP